MDSRYEGLGVEIREVLELAKNEREKFKLWVERKAKMQNGRELCWTGWLVQVIGVN